MNCILTPDRIADLAGISQICEELGADLVVIGATSLLILMGDLGRFTRDVDLTAALDFDEFERLTTRLAAIGWTPSPKLEHRWIAPRRTIIDLLPAGAELRRSGSITWPASQFKMSLAGFEHVFAHAVEVHLPEEMTIRVAPPIITALLKIIAWVDDPYRRAKDLQDIPKGGASEATMMAVSGHLAKRMLEHCSHVRMANEDSARKIGGSQWVSNPPAIQSNARRV